MSNEQEFNPLEGWTKEQIKSTLKGHSKAELLKIAMSWRLAALELQHKIDNELHKAEHSQDPQEDTYDDAETGTSVED